MKRLNRRVAMCALSVFVLVVLAHIPNSNGETPRDLRQFQITEPLLTADFVRLQGALSPIARDTKGKFEVNRDKMRGAGSAVYPVVAPAVVVVHTGDGHGTGFIVDPEGWIITNHHVVRDAPTDPKTHTQVATVMLGQIRKGWMVASEQTILADVYKTSPEKDLALLKLRKLPQNGTPLVAIKLAQDVPIPGSDCCAIGHPARGLLWTLRTGEVSGVGNWPSEMIEVVMRKLALAGSSRSRLESEIKSMPQRKVLISTCGLNPGDSGGPLVNGQGELIAVSFAIPTSDPDQRVSYDKFSYHVHLDELKQFLKSRPSQAPIHVPDSWPQAPYTELANVTRGKIPDTLVFSLDGNRPCAVLLDVDRDSSLERTKEGKLAAPDQKSWDFEFGLHLHPKPCAFYDTDNDGHVDLVLCGSEAGGETDIEYRLEKGAWKAVTPTSTKLIDAAHFRSRDLQKRFGEFKRLWEALGIAKAP